jgi:hypothetical protein
MNMEIIKFLSFVTVVPLCRLRLSAAAGAAAGCSSHSILPPVRGKKAAAMVMSSSPLFNQ